YVQDDWRVTPKLTLNMGLRFEREGGFKERYNRALVGFDPNAELPIAAGAQAAYAKIALPELPANQFVIKGGSVYLGQPGRETSHMSENMWLPRFGAVYQLNDKTVIRGGYGVFFDTNNVLNNDLNQLGFSRTTSTQVSNDNGLTFTASNLTSAACRANASACTTIFSDPFPVLSGGQRFLSPIGNALGVMAGVGRSINFYIPNDWKHARQQRWRFSIQRQLSNDMALEVAYLGSYSDRISVSRRIDALPEQYWSTGNVRDTDIANLNAQVTNPFNISNFASLQTSNPVLYEDMNGNGFFRGATIQRATLLRPYPHLSNSNNSRDPIGEVKYHDVELTLNKRFSQGMLYSVSYIRSWNRERTSFDNEFDAKPVWLESNQSRPHHLMFNALFELPFGKGKQFLSNSGIANAFLGGWQVSAIYHLQSGPLMGLGNWFYYSDDLRALTKSRDERTTDAWFNWHLLPGATRDYSACTPQNPNACDAWMARASKLVPADKMPANLTFNKAEVGGSKRLATPVDFQPNSFHRRVFPQRLSWLRSSNMNQIDMNLARNFSITETFKAQFRVDMINALNHVTYQGPNTDITSANFGRVTAQDNTPRWLQFMLRFTF
ncbi:MAG TPA: TonB-dependent receptor, partial [Blastocatellia bacterium]|nr:TonB-dependent receptor [Blastocatellia bacterium]